MSKNVTKSHHRWHLGEIQYVIFMSFNDNSIVFDYCHYSRAQRDRLTLAYTSFLNNCQYINIIVQQISEKYLNFMAECKL